MRKGCSCDDHDPSPQKRKATRTATNRARSRSHSTSAAQKSRKRVHERLGRKVKPSIRDRLTFTSSEAAQASSGKNVFERLGGDTSAYKSKGNVWDRLGGEVKPTVFERLGAGPSSGEKENVFARLGPKDTTTWCNVLVIGQSFVWEAGKYCEREGIKHLGLNPKHYNVTFAGRDGATLQNMLSQFHNAILQSRPHVVVMDVGTSNKNLPRDDQRALEVVDMAEKIYRQGVQAVVVLELLPSFTLDETMYNEKIRLLCNQRNTNNNTDIRFWHHKDAPKMIFDIMEKGFEWSPVGYAQYLRSLKACVGHLLDAY